jgi:DNA polymerase III epsilon subunit-like protein
MTTKIDHRKNYYIVFDTETANGLDDPIVYDIGGAVVDKKGNVYETFSFIIYEVFCEMKDLMQSAYYANKIPMYEKQIANGERKIVKYATAKKYINELAKKYNIKAMVAHNARFDYRSTTKTQRYLTKSKYRWFLPYGVELWDTMKMANDTICKQVHYKEFCYNNGYLTKNGRVRKTAEILYRYISGEHEFIEEHTGLADVMIEKEIFAHCLRQHKPMRKKCFA